MIGFAVLPVQFKADTPQGITLCLLCLPILWPLLPSSAFSANNSALDDLSRAKRRLPGSLSPPGSHERPFSSPSSVSGSRLYVLEAGTNLIRRCKAYTLDLKRSSISEILLRSETPCSHHIGPTIAEACVTSGSSRETAERLHEGLISAGNLLFWGMVGAKRQ